ncbi:hypothetical protein [Aminomonas paucivorans]|uniref:Uncharacterized protein n=1 Tax=Aminomonas paucivorans DSM 12260 TaxID=584708 RepID=E3CW54_9BACT|nr:hypothetical protein [Aminomonas paucivorans]EFQ22512.1 hypothetical protein Apau_0072 [Aminomonas paucivorans DSM 12260]
MPRIPIFPILRSQEDVLSEARRKGGPLGRLLLRGQALAELRLHFVEYRVLLFSVLHRPNWISRNLFKDRGEKRQLCRVLVNGSTGGALWAEEIPEPLVSYEAREEQIQHSSFPRERMEEKGSRLVLRVLRRRVGGYPEVNLEEDAPVYRPFYVALYGEPREGCRVRYLPFAADGCSSHRTF